MSDTADKYVINVPGDSYELNEKFMSSLTMESFIKKEEQFLQRAIILNKLSNELKQQKKIRTRRKKNFWP